MSVFGFIIPNPYLLLPRCTFLIAKQSKVFLIEVFDRLGSGDDNDKIMK